MNRKFVLISKKQILERRANKFGTGCHVVIPKKYSGKNVKVILEKRGEK